tara:strand:- start:65 stop:979 length:915 start_codon:yes stop_codon:yes gene_type:complete
MLTLKIKNIEFNNPIFVASGTYGYGHEVDDIADVSSLGAIVTKSVTLKPREGNNPPRIAETSSGMLNSIGLANLGIEKFCSEKISYLNKLNTNVIINIAGSTEDEYIKVLEKLEEQNSKHVGYEINISCPNVKKGGMEFGVDPLMTEELTRKLRKLTNKALIMKLSPNVTSIESIAKAAEYGGADAVSAINTVIGMGIDTKTFKTKLYTNIGGLSGPAIKPIAIANVHKIYKSISIPIIGIGGISNANDVLEFILAGADCVQIGTLNYTNPNIGVEIVDDLKKICKINNIDNICDLKGQVLYHD